MRMIYNCVVKVRTINFNIRCFEINDAGSKNANVLFGKLNAAVSVRLKRVFQST